MSICTIDRRTDGTAVEVRYDDAAGLLYAAWSYYLEQWYATKESKYHQRACDCERALVALGARPKRELTK